MIPHLPPSAQGAVRRAPAWLAAGLARSVLLDRPRSIARDGQRAIAGRLPVAVLGGENVPPAGPCLVVCNHYTRPGLPAWWFVLAVSAAVAGRRPPSSLADVRWVITAAWTFPRSRWRSRFLTPVTRWAFARTARCYGFETMPPMPPDPREVEDRARAVRRCLRLARQVACDGGLMGLAPEGRDHPGGLGPVPPGVGDFMALLVHAGLPFLPVGIGEQGGRLCLSFGPLFQPDIPAARSARDAAVSGQVMAAIAAQYHAAST